MKNRRDGLYNSTIAQAFFEFLGEPCAQYIPACTKFPYYQIVTKNFLTKNQKMVRMDDVEFINNEMQEDENNNLSHEQVMQTIEKTIKEKYLNQVGEERCLELCNKLRLQYSIQETIKKLIVSMDQNLGNTSFVISEDENEKMTDVNISPAYDLDLSFLLGEEILSGDYSNQIFYRTTKDGKTDLIALIKEFSDIPGYREKIEDIIAKFQNNYLDEIFEIAYKDSKIGIFRSPEIKEKFGNFIMQKVCALKQAYKKVFVEKDKQIKKD